MGRGVRLIAGLLLVVALAGGQAAGAGSPRKVGDHAGLGDHAGSPLPVHWQPYSQGLPSYAMVTAVASQPPGGDIVYAGTYEPPGLWRSADRGSSWQIDDRGLEGSPVYALHWDAVRGCWWAGTRNGLYTRPAGGLAWRTAGEVGRIVYALAEDGAGALYAATEDGLFRFDGANTSEVTPAGGEQGAMAVLAVAVSPDGRTLLAGTAGQGLWLSRDGGATWSAATVTGSETDQALAHAYVTAVFLDARPSIANSAAEAGAGSSAASVAYASTSRRAYRSADGGATWQAIETLDDRVQAFATGPHGDLYAAMAGRVARSSDGGLTWTHHAAGLREGEKVLDLAVAPGDPLVVHAGAWDGLYASTDGGQNWAKRGDGLGYPDVNALAWDASGNLLAGTRSGLFRRSSDGASWEAIPGVQGRTVLSIARAGDGRSFYAGCSGGLFRSTDGAATWSEVASELRDFGIAGLVVDPADPDHLTAWVAFGRVHESQDGGRTWVARWEGLGDVRPVTAIHRTSAGQQYVGTEDGIFRWSAAGRAWEPLSFSLVLPTIFAVVTDARDPAAVYAGATDGLWRSPDRGQSWRRWGTGLEGVTVTRLAVSPVDRQVAFAGTRHAGLYVTGDRGATWQPAWQDRLALAAVRDILFSDDGRTVYVASDRGIFQGEVHAAP